MTLICDYPNIMAVPMSSPAHSVKEFIDYANANKGKITFASSGHGTSVHLSGELFKRMAKIELLHVPYRGAGPAFSDLIPGRVDVMFNNTGAVLPLIAGEQAARARGNELEAHAAGSAVPADRRGGRARLRCHVLVRLLCAGQDPAGDHPQDECRRGRSDPRSGHQVEARSTRRRGDRLNAGGAGPFLKREMDKWGPVIKEAGITGSG